MCARYEIKTVESEIDHSITLKHYELYDNLTGLTLMCIDTHYEQLNQICMQLNDHYNLIQLLGKNNVKLKMKVEELGGNWYEI